MMSSNNGFEEESVKGQWNLMRWHDWEWLGARRVFPRCMFAQLRRSGQTRNYDPTSFQGAIFSGNPSKVTTIDQLGLTTWNDAYYMVFWTFPRDFPKEIGPVSKVKLLVCRVRMKVQPLSDGPTAEDVFEVPGSNLVHQIIRCCFPMGQNWLPKSWDWWRKSTSWDLTKLQKFRVGLENVTSQWPWVCFWEFWEDNFQLHDRFKQRVQSRFPNFSYVCSATKVPQNWWIWRWSSSYWLVHTLCRQTLSSILASQFQKHSEMLRIVDIRKLHHKISCIAVAIGVFWSYFPFLALAKDTCCKYIRYSPPVKVNEYSSYVWTNGNVLTLPRPQRSLWMVKWYRLILNAPARGQWKLKDDIMDGWDPCLSHVVAR